MSPVRALPLALLALFTSQAAQAGAFIFAEDYPDAVTHPQIYSGTGGERADLTVCLDRSVNSSLTGQAEPAVIKAIDTWNRGRSLGADNYALNSATDIASGFFVNCFRICVPNFRRPLRMPPPFFWNIHHPIPISPFTWGTCATCFWGIPFPVYWKLRENE